ncbi:hypothetical protein [Arthrobacter sp. P2b]|nr:hypothetical protein [Arthrobacter sp. P2b]SLK00976.1 hypothetical protein SAMN06272721_103209 [Arthrobacter sp. P2b]
MHSFIPTHKLRPEPESPRMASNHINSRQESGPITQPLLCGIAGAEAL